MLNDRPFRVMIAGALLLVAMIGIWMMTHAALVVLLWVLGKRGHRSLWVPCVYWWWRLAAGTW